MDPWWLPYWMALCVFLVAFGAVLLIWSIVEVVLWFRR